MKELMIGSHVSFNKENQLVGSVLEAIGYQANTFMFYTGAPQNTVRSSISNTLTEEAYVLMKEHGISLENVIVHAPYIINLANTEDIDRYHFSIRFLKEEIKRCENLGMTKLVLHPGSFVHLDRETGIRNICNALNEVLKQDMAIDICLETMAGKGSELGITLEELKQIIDGVVCNHHIKVCLDTCHLHDAGYDIESFECFLNEFDKLIGIDRICCVHINDSKNVRGAHKDRHENVGYGFIGFDTLCSIIYHPKLKDVPKILETPYVDKLYPPYKFEIESIKNGKFNSNLIEDIMNFYK